MIAKALLIWFLIAIAETLHGILRLKLLNRRLGDRRARRVGVFTGSAIIFAIGWFAVPWIGPAGAGDSISLGALWLFLMLAFDIAFGRFYLHLSWRRIASDFDIREGNLLGIGMAVLFFTPLIVARSRGLY